MAPTTTGTTDGGDDPAIGWVGIPALASSTWSTTVPDHARMNCADARIGGID
jgi:hypothetical protein